MPWLGCRGWHVVLLELGWGGMLYFLLQVLWPYISNLNLTLKPWESWGYPSLSLTQIIEIYKPLFFMLKPTFKSILNHLIKQSAFTVAEAISSDGKTGDHKCAHVN